MDNKTGLHLCGHCTEFVSRSTLERHETKRLRMSIASDYDNTTALEESDSDSHSVTSAVSGSSDVSDDSADRMKGTDVDLSNHCPDATNDDINGGNSGSEQATDCSECESTLGDSTDEENSEECWDDVLPNDLESDLLGGPSPLPDHVEQQSRNVAHSLVFWLLYFLLIWQLSCHISENGMAWLLRFLSAWLKVLGLAIPSELLGQLVTIFPGSLYMLRQFFNFDRDDFDKYVVCKKCYKLYRYDECLTTVNNNQVAKVCSGFIQSRGKKVKCEERLVQKVQLKNGKSCFYPIKYYCCNSVINAFERLLKKEGFAQKCEQWRNRSVENEEMADFYDGKIWKDFMRINEKDFLKAPNNYGFMLNFDFFQPFKRRNDYSVGVFYLVVLNLPRAERYKWENVIVIGIVPSLDKEPKNLNTFLEPAISELQHLWKGTVKLESALCRFPLTFRAAILSVSADVAAIRKLAGFKSHAATHGCSRCMKSFPGGLGVKKDYSGFDKISWDPRTDQKHRQALKKLGKIKTQTKRDEFCRNNGITHYSILLDLDYFDGIRFFTVDPMHNLFLGTAKTMFNLWSDQVLSKKNLQEIEKIINIMEIPSDIGRLPMKISSNSGCYAAEQWKNWTLIYSLFCLKNILPEDHFKCWQSFVLACKYICQPMISRTDLEISDGLFTKFGKQMEQLYGKQAITPNMHLHCHLRDIVRDHGPVASFWCFSFERFNGILGSMPTNKRSVELQLMRKLKMSHFFEQVKFPVLFKDELFHLCSLNTDEDKTTHWLENSSWSERLALQKLAVVSPMPEGNIWGNQSGVFLPKNYTLSSLDPDDGKLLLEVYRMLYKRTDILEKDMSQLIQKYGSVSISAKSFGSRMEPRRIRSGKILASWPANCGVINTTTFSLSPGMVNFYFTHKLSLDGECVLHTFASVKWNKPDEERSRIGNPIQVWSSDYQEGGPSSFIPVQRIHSQFASAKLLELDGSDGVAISGIARKTFL